MQVVMYDAVADDDDDDDDGDDWNDFEGENLFHNIMFNISSHFMGFCPWDIPTIIISE